MNTTIITPARAARSLGVTTDTLARWRATGRGPLWTRDPRGHIRYSRYDVFSWGGHQTGDVPAPTRAMAPYGVEESDDVVAAVVRPEHGGGVHLWWEDHTGAHLDSTDLEEELGRRVAAGDTPDRAAAGLLLERTRALALGDFETWAAWTGCGELQAISGYVDTPGLARWARDQQRRYACEVDLP